MTETWLRKHRWALTFGALAIASAGCAAMVAMRVIFTGTYDYVFLLWNLALAWVPFLLALGIRQAARSGTPGALLLALGIVWLLFLPNAPYIVTDFSHLGVREGAPLWFDAGCIGASAVTGLLLGFASLYLMQRVTENYLGTRAIWLFVTGVLTLSSVGIYLGRFQRLNSWDAVTQPHRLADMAGFRLLHPFSNPTLLTVIVFFTLFLTVVYLLLYAFAEIRVHHHDSNRREY
jgi:uncharacterized membrane protein